MSDSGDVTHRITISATGQGIDETTDSVKALGDAVDDPSTLSALQYINSTGRVPKSGTTAMLSACLRRASTVPPMPL
jgi:hypothetical protein